jgi:hypothetical protein
MFALRILLVLKAAIASNRLGRVMKLVLHWLRVEMSGSSLSVPTAELSLPMALT